MIASVLDGQRDLPSAVVRRRRRHLVLALAALTTVVEAASVLDLVGSVRVGALRLSAGILPATLLAAAAGTRLAGRSARRRYAIGYWVLVVALLTGLAGAFVQQGRFPLWISLMVAALGEELVYRLAVPTVVAALLRRIGVAPARARIAGLTLAGVWFVVLPGHVDQMDSAAKALPFVAFAALSAFVVHRSGSVLPMAAAHAVGNLFTVLIWNDTVAADVRSMLLSCVLGLLVLAYGRPRRLAMDPGPLLVDTWTGLEVATIDLREGRPHTVHLTDGTVVHVEGDLQLPPGSPAVVPSVPPPATLPSTP